MNAKILIIFLIVIAIFISYLLVRGEIFGVLDEIEEAVEMTDPTEL